MCFFYYFSFNISRIIASWLTTVYHNTMKVGGKYLVAIATMGGLFVTVCDFVTSARYIGSMIFLLRYNLPGTLEFPKGLKIDVSSTRIYRHCYILLLIENL